MIYDDLCAEMLLDPLDGHAFGTGAGAYDTEPADPLLEDRDPSERWADLDTDAGSPP